MQSISIKELLARVAVRLRVAAHSPLVPILTCGVLIPDILCGLFGGGDMNGIALIVPEWVARVGFGVLLLVNGLVFWKRVLPVYSRSFSDTEVQA